MSVNVQEKPLKAFIYLSLSLYVYIDVYIYIYRWLKPTEFLKLLSEWQSSKYREEVWV